MADQRQAVNVSDDFEAGKLIFEALKELSNARQERVLRWVAESLGITPPPERPPLSAAALPSPLPPPPASHEPNTPLTRVVRRGEETSIRRPVRNGGAFYYRFTAPTADRRDAIDVTVAQDATRLANWERLTNPNATLNNAKKQGYLNSRTPGRFAISTVGENLVARALPAKDAGGKAPKHSAKKAAKNGAAKKTKAVVKK